MALDQALAGQNQAAGVVPQAGQGARRLPHEDVVIEVAGPCDVAQPLDGVHAATLPVRAPNFVMRDGAALPSPPWCPTPPPTWRSRLSAVRQARSRNG